MVWCGRRTVVVGTVMVGGACGLSPGLVLPVSATPFTTLGSPVVHKYSDGWVMWLHGRQKEPRTALPPISSGQIGVARSEDGLSWEFEGVTLLENSDEWWAFDSAHVGLGDVVPIGESAGYRNFAGRSSGTAKAMYTFGGADADVELRSIGIDRDGSVPAMDLRVGVCFSQGDADKFARVEGEFASGEIVTSAEAPGWDAAYLGWPSAVDGRNGARYLTYQALDTRSSKHAVGLVIDRGDGVHFKKLSVDTPFFEKSPDPDAFDAAGVSRRCLRPSLDGQPGFLMWYEGLSAKGAHAVGFARYADRDLVPDGRATWTKHPDPVFRPSDDPEAWDSGVVSAPYVCQLDDGSLRMYYAGSNGKGAPQAMSIGAAHSTDGGRSWTRVDTDHLPKMQSALSL